MNSREFRYRSVGLCVQFSPCPGFPSAILRSESWVDQRGILPILGSLHESCRAPACTRCTAARGSMQMHAALHARWVAASRGARASFAAQPASVGTIKPRYIPPRYTPGSHDDTGCPFPTPTKPHPRCSSTGNRAPATVVAHHCSSVSADATPLHRFLARTALE